MFRILTFQCIFLADLCLDCQFSFHHQAKKKKSLRYKELLSVNETQRIITVQNSKGHKIIDIAVLKIIVD